MNRKIYPDQGIVDRLNEVLTAQGSDSTWAKNLGVQRKTVLAYRHGVSDISEEGLWCNGCSCGLDPVGR